MHPTKYLLLSAFVICFGISSIITAYADITVPGTNNPDLNVPAQQLNQLNNSPINNASQLLSILAKITQWMYTIFFILAVIFILLAAYNFLFAQGDPEKIKTARKQIIWAAVAIAVALLSVGATQIIQSFIGSGSPANYTSPNPGTTLPGQEP